MRWSSCCLQSWQPLAQQHGPGSGAAGAPLAAGPLPRPAPPCLPLARLQGPWGAGATASWVSAAAPCACKPMRCECSQAESWSDYKKNAQYVRNPSRLALHCITMHFLALRIPRYRYTDPGVLGKPCTLVHLCSGSRYTNKPLQA